MLDKIQFIFKISSSLLISYLLVSFFSEILFVGNTPTLRQNPNQYLAQKLEKTIVQFGLNSSNSALQQTKPLISVDKYKEIISTTTANELRQVATGTYAANIDGKQVEIIKLNEIPMKEYTYTLKSGKQIKVRVPLSDTPPSQEEIEE